MQEDLESLQAAVTSIMAPYQKGQVLESQGQEIYNKLCKELPYADEIIVEIKENHSIIANITLEDYDCKIISTVLRLN